VKQNI